MPSGLTQADISAALDVLTDKSQKCQGPANQINIVNIALAVSGFGPIPVVVNRLSDIVQACSTTINQLNTIGPFTVQSDEDAILKSLATFVEVHQALLNILIGKSGLVPNLLPYVGPPIAQALRQIESVVDTMLWQLKDLLPDKQSDVTSQKDTIDKTLEASINAWSA